LLDAGITLHADVANSASLLQRPVAMPHFSKFSMTIGRVLRGRMACAAVLLLAANTVSAADFGCTNNQFGANPMPIVYTLPKGPIKINPDVANGTVLYSVTGLTATGHNFSITTCKNLAVPTVMKRTMVDRAYLGGGVYESGIPGIGLMLMLQGTDLPLENGSFSSGYKYAANPTARLKLVKTGPITQMGVLENLRATTFLPAGDNYVVETWNSIGSLTIDPGKPTCKVTTPTRSVSLLPVPKSKLNAIGTVTAAEGFTLGMSCSGGDTGKTLGIFAVLTDQNAPGNRSETLSLGGDSTAAGVGIQILRNGSPLGYGPDSTASTAQNRWKVGTYGNVNFTIPLSARYIQTDSVVTAGTVNARATFTLSYE
jgi:type 1 fimbria pilin